MVLVKVVDNNQIDCAETHLTRSKKRRIRRRRLQAARAIPPKKVTEYKTETNTRNIVPKNLEHIHGSIKKDLELANVQHLVLNNNTEEEKEMSSKEITAKSRDDVIAAREAKKLAKQKARNKAVSETKEFIQDASNQCIKPAKDVEATKMAEPKSKDEVDRAIVRNTGVETDQNRELVKSERAAKKAAKQTKKKGATEDEAAAPIIEPEKELNAKIKPECPKDDMTVKDVVETLKDIVNVAKEVKEVTAKVSAMDLGSKKQEEEAGKSKAELRAERRAKQDAQRAAKQEAEQKAAKPKAKPVAKPEGDMNKLKEVKSTKQKSIEKPKAKSQSVNRVNWFQHLYTEHDTKNITINSNLHPAIIKLGVQLSTRVVKGSNARCIALLDALKKMVRDYTLPAKTEFARGLESHLAASLHFLWSMRQPSASQTNAVKFFRHHLTQLPNNVDEFDAKKTLQAEIDRYIREQIDMAGEAISIAVRKKISHGDNIMTYGCSSLIERILVEAWAAGVQFRAVVVGNGVQRDGAEMVRRLRARARGLPCAYTDISALSALMHTMNKVVLGAGALLVNGSVVGAAGSAQVALAARACNVPVLVACETHKFSERVHTDAFVYNEIGDPDDLIDKSDENSPLKDWRSNPNLNLLNLTYDVTPPSLVTAVVTELAILPCTSAPVVLRFKLSEYGV